MVHDKPILFDYLVKWVEAGIKLGRITRDQVMYKHVMNAALFWFPKPAHEGLPKEYTDEKLAWLQDNVYLPFPVVAIEDRATLTIFADQFVADENGRDLLRGADVPRLFLDVLPYGNSLRDDLGFKDPERSPNFDGHSFIVTTGYASLVEMSNSKFKTAGKLQLAILVDPRNYADSQVIYRDGELLKSSVRWQNIEILERTTLQNVGMSLQSLCVLCDRDNFILEATPPEKPNPFPKRKKWQEKEQQIRRVAQRPLYRVLRPKEIREVMQLPEIESENGTHASPVPHPRRGHIRRLMSEKFTHSRGKQIFIKSTWVGPSESVVNGVRYKVLLDH